MKKIFILLVLLFFYLVVFSEEAVAHGGVQKLGGSTVVTIRQQPLSTLVGEKVKFTFVVSDPNFIPDPKLSGVLSVYKIETIGGKAKDVKLLEKSFITSANGAF